MVKNYPHTADIGPNSLRKILKFTVPHYIRDCGSLHLRGRREDMQLLEEALRNAAVGHQMTPRRLHYFVLGAAGLGKTELVTWVARALVREPTKKAASSKETPFLFSAVIFVELRARDSEDLVRTAISEAMRKAGLTADNGERGYRDLRHALIILDNADDPYKHHSNQTHRWFEGTSDSNGLLRELERCEPGAILITLRDEGRRALFTRKDLKNAYKQTIEPLTPEAGCQLLADEMPQANPKLEVKEQSDILAACGARGVSPLALKVVCGVLRELEQDWDGEQDRRSAYLMDLSQRIGSEDAFVEVQSVMKCSFGYLSADLRKHFLKLFLFPDQFTRDDAARLLTAADASSSSSSSSSPKVADILDSLVRYNILARTTDGSNAGGKAYLILDHIWVFAASEAEDPASEHLSREDFADAVQRFIRFADTRDRMDRIWVAGKYHARQVLRLSGLPYREHPRDEADHETNYRSLSVAAPYDRRKLRKIEPSNAPDDFFSPINMDKLSAPTRDRLREAALQFDQGDLARYGL